MSAALAALGGIPQSTAGGGFGFPILPAIVMVPAAAAVALALVPRARQDVARWLGTGASLAVAGLAIAMAVRFRTGQPGYQFVVAHHWISSFGVQWKLGVDGISVFIVAVTAVLFPVAIAAPGVERDFRSYAAWMLLLETGCLGALMSLDLLLFFLFFELTLPPMYMLIARWGASPRRSGAALKFFLYTFAGSALMLIALLTLAFLHERSTGHLTFDLVTLTTQQHLSKDIGILLFLGFASAFAVKVPIFPFHTWLPDAQVEASTGGSMVLAGVMFTLGTYGLVRFCIELFPSAAVSMAPLMLTLGAIGVIYGFLVAVVQTDLKRMIAYTLVADLGVIVVGLFGFTSQGFSGSVYQTVNHGVSMAAMFLLIGILIDRLGTSELPEMGGVQKRAPIMAAVFLVVTLSVVGVPGLNGFIGEFLLLLGTFLTHRWWAVVATVGVILAALVFLWAYQQAFHGTPRTGRTSADLRPRELLAVAPLVVLIVGLGVYPRPFLDRINPSADRVLGRVVVQAHNPPPPVAAPRTSGASGVSRGSADGGGRP